MIEIIQKVYQHECQDKVGPAVGDAKIGVLVTKIQYPKLIADEYCFGYNKPQEDETIGNRFFSVVVVQVFFSGNEDFYNDQT